MPSLFLLNNIASWSVLASVKSSGKPWFFEQSEHTGAAVGHVPLQYLMHVVSASVLFRFPRSGGACRAHWFRPATLLGGPNLAIWRPQKKEERQARRLS